MSTNPEPKHIADLAQEYYLDFVENYQSVQLFAEHNRLYLEEAHALLAFGAMCHKNKEKLNVTESVSTNQEYQSVWVP